MKILIILSLILSLGCASVQKTETKNENKASRNVFKNERTVFLNNGLKVYFIQDDSLPKIDLQLLIPVGAVSEDVVNAGISSFTADLLDQGTQSKKALEISDLFADAGSGFEVQPGYDFTVFGTTALTTEFQNVMNLFFEVLTKPTFASEEVERTRQQRQVMLQSRRDRAGTYADTLTAQNFYKNLPYGRDMLGTQDSLKKITRQDIQNFYKKYYGPSGAILTVSGRFDAAAEEKVKSLFSGWKGGSTYTPNRQAFNIVAAPGPVTIDSPHKAQAEIRIIEPGMTRANPDYLKIRLANEVLGGSFASRLNQRVRDDLGLTYSIYSYMDARDRGGAWAISTFAKPEVAQKAIDETMSVLQKFVSEGVTADELKAAKNLVKAQFPRNLETSDKLAYNLMALDFYGIGVQYLTTFNEKIDSYSLDDINKAIKQYLKPDQMMILQFK